MILLRKTPISTKGGTPVKTPIITKIEIQGFTWDVKGLTHGRAFHYDLDSTLTRAAAGIKIYAVSGA
jgi:hypothetical protein